MENASSKDLTFFNSTRYNEQASKTKAVACITKENLGEYLPRKCIKIFVKNVLFTNNDSAYETAISLFQKGIKIEAIIDNRENVDSKLVKEIEKNNIKIYKGYTINDVPFEKNAWFNYKGLTFITD